MQNNIRRRGNCYLLYSRRGSKPGQDYIECIVEHRKEKSISHSVARTKLVPNLIQLGCSNLNIAFENSPHEQQNCHSCIQVSTSMETIDEVGIICSNPADSNKVNYSAKNRKAFVLSVITAMVLVQT